MVQIEELRAAFAARLKKALADNHVETWGAGVRLSKMTGVTPKAASKWLNGEAIPGPAKMRALSEGLNTPLGWLQNGAEEASADRSAVAIEPSNVAMIPQPAQMYSYPVISWVTAGAWSEAVQPFPDGFSDRYDVSDYKAKGSGFWLEVKGDSMTSTSPPSVPEGSQILVDTEADVRPGKLVIAKLASSNEATFKKLVEDGGVRYLKPLNSAYPTVQCTEDCRIVGVVVRSLTKFA
ncbi:repressor protein c2 [Pseudomonas amygdali pv. tabaci str. ATCC 11528]|uniref:LexA family protein n=1 Tax=Pseudomonas amygdali TaxID=47877 RepID=UPI00062B97F9|nr:S24 family peptidase [Pseudomonas amygdali]KKY51476.1 repressor protein c2 [Pseudomonas amygdali pv. tabaci str. ATCC 11528]